MASDQGVLAFGEFELDFERLELRCDGERVEIQPTPLRVLLYLAGQRDRTVSKQELLDTLWPGTIVTDGSLANALNHAREAVGDDGTAQRVIRTLKGHGNRFVAAVSEGTGQAGSDGPLLAAPVARQSAGVAREIPRPSAQLPFVGRVPTLARLDAALDDVRAGAGRIVLLAGEPGIGKTRTAEEFARRARAQGVAVYTGWCDESGIAPPYWPWVRLLRAVLEDTPVDSLRADLGSGAVSLSRILPELHERWPDLPTPPELGPDELRFQLSDAIYTLFRRLAARQSVLLIVDDLHRADEATLGVLRFVAREIGRASILVLGTYRDTEVGQGHPLAETLAELARQEVFERIPLEGFSHDEVGELVRRLADRELSPELVEAIVGRTEGNPLFVTELIRALPTGDGTGGSDNASRLEVPRGLREVILGRLAELSPTCHEALTVASVIGRDFAPELIEAASPLDADSVDHAIDEARMAGVVGEGPGGEPRFAHVLVRDAVYAEIRHGRRAELHRTVADAMVKTSPARLDEQAMLLMAHHRACADQRLEAAHWYWQACAPLFAKSHREGYRCSRAGLAVLDDLKGLTPAEGERAGKLIHDFSRLALFGGLLVGISRAEADAIGERAIEMAGGLPLGSVPSDPEVARQMAYIYVGYSDVATLWDDDESIRHAYHARALADRSADEGARLQTAVTLVARLSGVARYCEACAIARREIDSPPANPLTVSDGMFNFPRILSQCAQVLAIAGEPQEALGHVRSAIRLLRKDERSVAPEDVRLRGDSANYRGSSVEISECVHYATICYYFLGDAGRASKCARTAFDSVQGLDSPHFQSSASYGLGLALRLQGVWEDLARAADGLGPERETWVYRLDAQAPAWAAEARAHLGEHGRAVEEVTALVAERSLEWEPGALVSCAHTLIYCEGARKRDKVDSVFERLESAIERTGARSYSPFLHELHAQLALACGGEETCEHERREAERLWTAMGAHGHIERMARELEELAARLSIT